MGKKSTLKEKKRVANAKSVATKFTLTIEVKEDNTINVAGPIGNPLLIMEVLAGAMKVVVDYNFSLEKQNSDIEAGRKEKEDSRIVGLDGVKL